MPAAGMKHTVLLRSDGMAVAFGHNRERQFDVPQPGAGVTYTQAAAGGHHTVLLTNDGAAVAFGNNDKGQCKVPEITQAGVTYTHT